MRAELLVAFVVGTLDGRLFEGAVHALDLPIRPRVVGFCLAVLDGVLAADPIEHVDAVASCRP